MPCFCLQVDMRIWIPHHIKENYSYHSLNGLMHEGKANNCQDYVIMQELKANALFMIKTVTGLAQVHLKTVLSLVAVLVPSA